MNHIATPGVSVVIDSFNTAEFIGEAVDSVLRQTHLPDQIVVVDASTDDSRRVIDQLAAGEPRIKTVYVENQGQLATIAAGLEVVDCDLVFLLDGDDLYEPDHINTMLAWWTHFPEGDLLYCRHKLFGQEGLVRVLADREQHESAEWLGKIDLSHHYDWGRAQALAWCLPEYHVGGITSALCFRKSHLAALPLPELLEASHGRITANADYVLLLASALYGGRKIFVPSQGVHHRIHEKSITGRHAGGDAMSQQEQRANCMVARDLLCAMPGFGPHFFDLLQSEMQAVPRLAQGHGELYTSAIARDPRAADNELRRLRSESFMLRGKLEALEASTSWRVTYPLRWLGDKCGAGLRQLRIKPGPALQHVPGVIAIDISNIWQSDSGTGIQRVVRTIATELARKARDGKQVVLVDFATGTPMDVTSGFLDGDRAQPAAPIRGMETLIMLDSSHVLGPPLARRLQQAKDDGIRIVSVCHDLLPLHFPGWFTAMNRRTFRRWLHVAAKYSNHFACVSQATANDLSNYLASRADLAEQPTISAWPLGRDFTPLSEVPGGVTTGLPKPNVVMVGTIEPRKNHDFVLDCFSKLQRSGQMEVSLVVVGRPGWHCRRTIKRLRQAEEEGWLTWFHDGISDERLAAVYRDAACVIQASRAEGFGLPVAEASNFGKPVVLSDIPVFREVVSSHGYFFQLDNEDSLARALAQALQENAPATETVSVTWRESAEMFWRECLGLEAIENPISTECV